MAEPSEREMRETRHLRENQPSPALTARLDYMIESGADNLLCMERKVHEKAFIAGWEARKAWEDAAHE